MKQALTRAGLAAMLSLGTVMPILGTLGLLSCGWMAAAAALLLSAMLGLASVRRWTMALVGGVGLIAAALWLLAMGGADTVMQVLRGVLLHASGVTWALPVMAQKTALTLTVLVTLLCFCLTSSTVGAMPAALATVLAAVMLWLSDAGALLPMLIPAAAAALTLIAIFRFDEVHVTRVLPVMAVIAAVALAAVPASGVTVGPMKQAAEELRQRILDYLFFTEPRDVFSLAGEGFYPEGVGQLGGAAAPNDSQVMMVYTPRITYLRGAIKNEYTGRVWQDTTGGRRYLWVSPRWRQVRDQLFDVDLVSVTLQESTLLQSEQVTVRMLRESESSLFVPQRVRSLSTGGDLVAYFNNSSEVFITRDLAPGDTYTVTAPLITAGEQGLDVILEACARTADQAVYEQVRHDYTALPEHLQRQVFELAQRAVEGADTPYEKAFALQNFLRRTYRYTLDVAPQPEDVDFVSNFLLITHEGYCTYFASAMTVLCRMVGLPARYVEGFVATPNGQGEALVTGKQAHAWTEVYFAGFGWLTFDATPPSADRDRNEEDGGSREEGGTPPKPSDDPSPAPSEEPTPSPTPEEKPQDASTPTPSPVPTPQPEEIPTPSPTQTPEIPPDSPEPRTDDDHAPGPWLWWLLALLALCAGVAARVWWMLPAREAARAKDALACWLVWMQALCELAAQRRLRREKYESMAAYLARLEQEEGMTGLAGLAGCANDVFYGGCVPTDDDVAVARGTYERQFTAIKPVQQFRHLLHRAFVPLKKRDFTKV